MIVTARLFAKEGLSEDEAVELIAPVRQGDPRGGSSLLRSIVKGDWKSIDNDIIKAVKNAFGGNGKQAEWIAPTRNSPRRSLLWDHYGFKSLTRRPGTQQGGRGVEEITIHWTEADDGTSHCGSCRA